MYKYLKTTLFLWGFMSFFVANSQSSFYATIQKKHAYEIQKKYPTEVDILGVNSDEAAVFITEHAAEELHHKVLVHGPGYVFQASKEAALKSIVDENYMSGILERRTYPTYTIDQQNYIKPLLDQIKADKIRNLIQSLENYGTRYHTTQKAKLAANEVKSIWANLASNRNDITVSLVQHQGSNMPSVVLSIEGSESPDEYVLLGGHLDSISGDKLNNAPGADDNASGISCITEVIRVLVDNNFKPKKTVQFMAFAAEEVGLIGSDEIASQYKNEGKNILSFMQLDMTNYPGSPKNMYFTTDTYVDQNLNDYLIDLINTYNSSGIHKITYGTSACNYGCSDHFSFAKRGYSVAFPIEATFSQSNPRLHTTGDTLANMDETAAHASRFVKLSVEYIVEMAKHAGGTVGGGDNQAPSTPQNVSINDIESTQFYVNWSKSYDNKAVKGYKVYVNDELAKTVVNNGVLITGLEPNTEYSVYVFAFDEAGNTSNKSAVVTQKTSGNVSEPCLKNNVIVNITTDKYGEETSWIITDSSNKSVASGTGYGKETTYTIPNCLPNGCYTFVITDKYKDGMCCQYGNGSYSVTIGDTEIVKGAEYGENESTQFCVENGEIADSIAPTAPTNLAQSNQTKTSVDLSWTASTDNVAVKGYEIYQNGNKIASTDKTSYQVTNLAAGQTYSFTVKAFDKVGNFSKASNTLSVTMPKDGGGNDDCTIGNVVITVKTDKYGRETAWKLLDEANKTVAQSKTYGSDKEYIEKVCLPKGCYSFIITDEYGDGICCEYGNGSYSVTLDGKEIAKGGDFQKSEQKQFCVDSSDDPVDGGDDSVSYCDAKGRDARYEWIEYVQLGSVENKSGFNSGYGNFVNKTLPVIIGKNTITVQAGFESNPYREYWKIGIDFNKDGKFSENETLVQEVSQTGNKVNFDFNVPKSASGIETRMRIQMSYDNRGNLCNTVDYGEVEDYTVVISDSNATTRVLNVYPNPAVDQVSLQTNLENPTHYQLVNSNGEVILDGALNQQNETISLSNVSSGNYFMTITNGNETVTKQIVVQ